MGRVEWGDWGRFEGVGRVETGVVSKSNNLRPPAITTTGRGGLQYSTVGRKWGDRTPFVMHSLAPRIKSIRPGLFSQEFLERKVVGGLALGQIFNKCGLI